MSASSEDNWDFGAMNLLDLDFYHDGDGNELPDIEEEYEAWQPVNMREGGING
jgi:hypothetical protein